MRSFHTCLLAAVLLSAAPSFAQTPKPTQPSNPSPTSDQTQNPAPGSMPTADAGADAILATWLHTCSTNEAALAAIAVKQAKSSEVRAFAQKMVDDHTAYAAKLQPFVGAPSNRTAKAGDGMPNPNDGRQQGGREDGRQEGKQQDGKQAADASGNRSRGMTGSFDHAGLVRELGAKNLATASKELSSKSAAEFDRCFVTMQVVAHAQAVDMLTVFRGHASQKLATTIEEGLTVYGAHHEQVVALQKKLGDAASEGRGGR